MAVFAAACCTALAHGTCNPSSNVQEIEIMEARWCSVKDWLYFSCIETTIQKGKKWIVKTVYFIYFYFLFIKALQHKC